MACRMARFVLVAALSFPLCCQGQGFLDQVMGEAGSLTKQAEKAGQSLAEQMSPALDSARNTTASAMQELEHVGKKAAVQALLWSSSKCPDFWESLAEAPEYLASKLAEAFASSAVSPSSSKEDCRSIAGAALLAADSELAGSSDQEKLAVKLSMEELMGKVCTDDLMEALSSMEEIRTGHSDQYKMAIGDRLLLRVLTEERLRAELTEYCGGDTEISQLFSDGHLEGDSARASLPPSSFLPPAAVASLFLAVAVVVTRRRHCSVAACSLGRDASKEAERGLMIVAE